MCEHTSHCTFFSALHYFSECSASRCWCKGEWGKQFRSIADYERAAQPILKPHPPFLSKLKFLTPSQSIARKSQGPPVVPNFRITWHSGFLLADAICRFVAVRKSIKQYISNWSVSPVPREIPNCLRSWEILCRKWVVLTWRKVREGVGERQWGGWDQLGPSEAAGGSARAAGNDESVSSSLISNYFTWEGVIKCDNNVVSTYHCGHYLLFVVVMRALQPYPFEATVPKTK